MDRATWLEWRRQGIGGSDIAAIMGRSPWAGPWDVWCSKVHGADQPDRPELVTGRRLERAVAEYARDRMAEIRGVEPTDLDLEPGRPIKVGILLGSPDFVVITGIEGGGPQPHVLLGQGLECKTARYPDEQWGPDLSDQVPESYRLQVRWYLALTGAREWWLAVFFTAAHDWRLYRIERDLDEQRELVEFAETWWQRHVVGGEPPEVDASDACRDWLVGQSPTARDEIRAATGDEEMLARDVHAAEQATKSLEAEAARARNRLRASMGDVRRVYFTGGAATWSRKSNRLTVRIDP